MEADLGMAQSGRSACASYCHEVLFRSLVFCAQADRVRLCFPFGTFLPSKCLAYARLSVNPCRLNKRGLEAESGVQSQRCRLLRNHGQVAWRVEDSVSSSATRTRAQTLSRTLGKSRLAGHRQLRVSDLMYLNTILAS